MMTLRTLFEKSSDADLPRETTGAAAGSVSWRQGLAALFVGLAALSLPATTTQAQEVEPDPISATLLRFVVAHDGASAFYLELDFSREPAGLSPDSIDGGVVGVEGGDITLVSRSSDRRWGLLVTPATTDCAAPHAVCAADGGMLARGTQVTIPGPVWFSVADATATEAPGATLDFTVTLSRAFFRTVTVDYATVDGTATAGADYTSTSGTLTFGWNETAKTVSVPVLDDAHDDGGESLTLALSNPSPSRARLADATATGTVADTDVTATLSSAVVEHDGAAPFDLHLDVSREPAGLSFRSIDGGVVNVQGGDVTRVWRRQAGSSRRWGVRVTPTSTDEVTVTVRATTDCAAPHAVCTAEGSMLAVGTQATIPGPVLLSVADATATEAPRARLGFAVTLSRAPGETVTVAYATSDGTATAGADYTSTSGTLTFQANETAKTVPVPVLVDTQDDGGETLTLTLSSPSPSRIELADATATGTIVEGDGTSVVPSAPTGVTARAGNGEAVLAWTAGPDNGSAVTKWQQRRSTDGGATWDPGWTDIAGSGATTVEHRVTGLANGTEYSFQLRAVNGEGAGAASGLVMATPVPAPSAPTGVTATAGDGQVVLGWTASPVNGSTVTGWQLRRSTDGGTAWDPGWTDIAGSDATTRSLTVTGLANGTEHTFQLRAVNASGAGAASAKKKATPRSGLVNPQPADAGLAGTVSGTLAGTLAVNRYGAATYEIPIEVPPGTAGVEPSLSLAYASNGGNGLLGLGWSLRGLSAIGRCPKTPAQDGARGAIRYDANDRFCLDGRRLVAVTGDYGADGTAYRTEIDGFSKIVSHGSAGTGPAWFEVRTKSGQTMEYGNTANSRIEAVGRSEARLWALNRVTDAVGNYLTVRYREEDGQGYPDRIDYTGYGTGGAPYASVRFAYQTRHDVRVLASGGSTQRMDERLAKVRTYHGETLVSEYRLGYSPNGLPKPSRVIRVERCDREGACLPATNFSWNDFGNGTLAPAEVGRVASGDFRSYHPLQGDFDGDGVTDLAWAHARNGGLHVWVARAEIDGSFAAPRRSSPKTSGNFSGYEPLVGDFNGDGLSDIVWAKADRSGLRAWVALGRGNGILAAARHFNLGTENFFGNKSMVGDFNGDGIADLASVSDSDTLVAAVGALLPGTVTLQPRPIALRAWVALGGSDGTLAALQRSELGASRVLDEFTAGIGDFNGDGLSDIVWTWSNSSGLHALAALGDGDGTPSAPVYSRPRAGSSSDYEPLVGDFNGDRVADLAWTKNSNSGSSAYTALGKGDGRFGAATYSALRTSSCSRNCSTRPTNGDFNGDGVSDVAWLGTRDNRRARAEISLGEGDGSFAAARVHEHQGHGNWSDYAPLAGDFDGDGVSDVAWTKASSSGLYVYTGLTQSSPGHGRVWTISSTTGPTFRLFYAPLTNTWLSFYYKDTGVHACALPCLDVQAPLYVVHDVEKDYGSGLVHSTTYGYGGAKVDVAGRGFLGFRWMDATDHETVAATWTHYRQDFPYIGQVSASGRDSFQGTALNVRHSWERRSLNGGKTVFPYTSRSVAKTYEVDDGRRIGPVATVTTSSTYDGYGNPTAMTVTTAGAGGRFVKTTANTYTNDTANWHLGRLTCARVTSQAPGRATRTRVSGFAYDAATGLLTKEVIEPGSGDVAGCVSAAAGTASR